MTDTLKLAEGDLAWQPTNAVLESVFDTVDVPTVGIFREGDEHFLFVCLGGVGARLSLWAYAPVRGVEITDEFPAGTPFDDAILDTLTRSNAVRFGVADAQGRLRSMSDPVSPGYWGRSLLRAARQTILREFDLDDFGIEEDELVEPAY